MFKDFCSQTLWAINYINELTVVKYFLLLITVFNAKVSDTLCALNKYIFTGNLESCFGKLCVYIHTFAHISLHKCICEQTLYIVIIINYMFKNTCRALKYSDMKELLSENNCHYLFTFQLGFVYGCDNGHFCVAVNSKVLDKHKRTDWLKGS